MLNFNDAREQRTFDVIPEGTIAVVRTKIRPGGFGEGGLLRRSKAGDSVALDFELVVTEGEYARRKIFVLLTLDGETEGHKEAGKISSGTIKAALESARNIRPDDKSEAAQKARQIESYSDLDGLSFICRIGVEPAKNGYEAKNRLKLVVTPEMKDWRPVAQDPRPASTSAPAAASVTAASANSPAKIERPVWAKTEA